MFIYIVSIVSPQIMRSTHIGLLLLFVAIAMTYNVQDLFSKREKAKLRHILEKLLVERGESCADPNMCRSKWGYCGTGTDYCGDGCQAGPCNNGGGGNDGGGDIINEQNFACAFNTIDSNMRANRLAGLRGSGWKPANNDEAAVFLAQVFHETDGLKTLREYCAPGQLYSKVQNFF
jgi:hypothetical protein